MDKKILFIGDSFIDGFGDYLFDHEERPFGNFWIDRGFTPYFLGDSSRDTQTILDIWVKYIPYLSANDLLVIIITFDIMNYNKSSYQQFTTTEIKVAFSATTISTTTIITPLGYTFYI